MNKCYALARTRTLILAGALVAAGGLTAAHASGCPADKVGTGVTEPPAEGTKAVGVTDDVLASTELSKEPAKNP